VDEPQSHPGSSEGVPEVPELEVELDARSPSLGEPVTVGEVESPLVGEAESPLVGEAASPPVGEALGLLPPSVEAGGELLSVDEPVELLLPLSAVLVDDDELELLSPSVPVVDEPVELLLPSVDDDDPAELPSPSVLVDDDDDDDEDDEDPPRG